ncbi:unnamed protein product [Clavelina lepadiformis]|uniref:Cadherin domain-containing protein n=1 Tax=Clavelina lepadiformis TaxID=159417 RepID=A0ABP0G7S6_CLALP
MVLFSSIMKNLFLVLFLTSSSLRNVLSIPTLVAYPNGEPVCEDKDIDDLIFTLQATGAVPVTYSFSDTSGDFTSYVTLDATTGALTLKRKFDAEIKGYFGSITFYATDSSGTTPPQSGSVLIKDANDNKPFIENQPLTPETYENPWNNEILLNIEGSDADSGAAGAVVWLIEGSNRFSINNTQSPNTFIVQNDMLDYEESPVVTFALNLSDAGKGDCGPNVTFSTQTTVVVTVLDGPDEAPFFTGSPYDVSVEENAPRGQSVTNVTAQDRDYGLNWKMDYSIIDDVENMFKIDKESGEITVAGDLDRESSTQGIIRFKVKAEEVVPTEWQSKYGYLDIFPLTDEAEVTVTIKDINDNSPTFYELADSTDTASKVKKTNFETSIYENTANLVSVPGLPIYIQDADEGSNAELSISISGDFADIFEVEPATARGEVIPTIRVQNSSALDYEAVKSYTIFLTATENATPEKNSATATVTINLEDINDMTPVFEENTMNASVAENSDTGTFVTTVTAVDEDTGVYGEVAYSIISSGNDFKIDPSSGNITVNGDLNRKKAISYFITIEARDGGGRFATASLQVDITDVNDNSPSFQRSSYSETVRENEASFSNPASIYATDDDEQDTKNSEIQFSIIDGDYKDNFTIVTIPATNPTEGEIKLKSPFDFESLDPSLLTCSLGSADIKLTVMAKDQGTPSLNSTIDVTITIENVNDNAPAFNQSSYTASVKEGSTPGTEVVKVFATDGDACNNDITYSISSDLPVEFLSAFSIETINSGSFGLLTVSFIFVSFND